MSLVNIKAKAAALTQTLDQIDNYRNQWTNGLKPKLLSKLRFVNDNLSLPYWYVTEQSDEANRESVFWAMPKLPSGISNKVTGSSYARYGGCLQFSQTINGQITVLVRYPYVEVISTQKQPEFLATLPPDAFSEAAIEGFMETFLVKIDEWFRGGEQPVEPIGFRLQPLPIA